MCVRISFCFLKALLSSAFPATGIFRNLFLSRPGILKREGGWRRYVFLVHPPDSIFLSLCKSFLVYNALQVIP